MPVVASVDNTKVDRSASSSSSSQSTTAFRTRPIGDRVYAPDDLEIYNLLQHPVWIFDMERKAMFWANTAALEVWNAATLEELISRDFTKMSKTIEERMQGQLDRIKRGEILSEQWTAYPKGKPKTLHLTGSAIRIDNNRIAALCEAELLYKTEAFDHTSVRASELLRYLPIPVRQFDGDGKSLKYQNPEAQALFGAGTSDSSVNRNSNEGCKEDEKSGELFEENAFLDRFVDRTLGKHVLNQVKEDHDYKVEADQYVNQGDDKIETRPFSICVRLTSDPVNAAPIILYSAREITDILHARKATAKANLKSDFMAVISHEIRTPLHQIIGYMELLELSGGLSESQLGTIKLVQSSSSNLQNIINDLLCFARLENGKLKLESKIFDPSEVLNACAASVKGEVQEKGLSLLHSNLGLPNRLIGDPYRLRQILFNLLENAAKYTLLGTISIIASLSESKNKRTELLRIEIKDTGIGIHPLHHARVFDKYEQVDSPTSWKHGGTGLGLSICKNLTEIMGGTITMKSELGKGTSFVLEIPFGVSHEKLKEAPDEKKKVAKDILPQKRVAEKGLTILVVEDNIVNQKMARKMLQRMGHVTRAANNGKEAVDEIRGNLTSFDLVLMDVQMPVLDGIDATKQIRKTLGLQKSTLPIVGLTAGFEPSALGYYKEIGMNTCIGKPVRMNSLERAINNAALERNLEELRLK